MGGRVLERPAPGPSSNRTLNSLIPWAHPQNPGRWVSRVRLPVANPHSLMRESPAPAAGHVARSPADAFHRRITYATIATRADSLGARCNSKHNLGREEPMRHSLSISLVLLGIVSAAALAVSGCARNEAAEQKAMPPLPQVTVAAAISRKVTEFLEFTRVTAPIAGRISRALVTSGNFVTNGQTLLTTLVSLDPIYVSFDGDEKVYLKYTKLSRDGAHGGGNPVQVGLADESGYPHQGVMVFVDNALDPATGTIRSRALLDNGDRLFTPGLFARLRLLGAHEHEAVLINDSAVGTDQTVRYVLVVSAGNKAEYRPVQLGPIVDGLRVVESGLASGETIVVNGLQRVRPGAQVQPQRVAMGERRPGEGVTLLARSGSSATDGEAHP